ncbi:MAG: hypothetical protein J0H59_00020, partial [Comamonadaceae bacterium]|nr:hypothetical protein [Comamonadaceae bacterium]
MGLDRFSAWLANLISLRAKQRIGLNLDIKPGASKSTLIHHLTEISGFTPPTQCQSTFNWERKILVTKALSEG